MRTIVALLFVVTLVGAGILLGLLIAGSREGGSPLIDFGNCESGVEHLATFEVIITATPDPNETALVYVVTATPMPGMTDCYVVPLTVRDQTAGPGTALSTTSVGGDYTLTPGQLPPGCATHILVEGENPSTVAEQYGVDLALLLAVNQLDEESSLLLQINDTLIVPLEGCPVENYIQPTVPGTAPEAIIETTAETTAEVTPGFTPTPTLAPTAANAQVVIASIIGAGDITSEGIMIQNIGNTVDISGWTLSDGDGNVFVFPERRLYTNGAATIYTRAGENTAIALFWGRDTAVFGQGDIIVLTDQNGNVQASTRAPETP